MTETKKQKKFADESNEDSENIQEYWTEHRITLIAFQTQFVYQKKPANLKDPKSETIEKSHKSKKKDIEYEGGFLFPGRTAERDHEVNATEQVKKSQCTNLKELFSSDSKNQNAFALRQFVRIMLELKHSSIFPQFLEVYEVIVREIKDISFESIRGEHSRMSYIERVTDKIIKLIQDKEQHFNLLGGYLKQNKRQTAKLFKVTIYCFLAEKHNFNINEYYAEAFEIMDEERPRKKRKIQ